jgi:tryptophanyl-tRNA synthetase
MIGSKKQRVLTGDRPTGRPHLGQWVGSLKNRLKLQDEYACFFLVADLHALTTHYDKPAVVKQNSRELVLDYLSVGIDPQKSVIYLQSLIPEVTELKDQYRKGRGRGGERKAGRGTQRLSRPGPREKGQFCPPTSPYR